MPKTSRKRAPSADPIDVAATEVLDSDFEDLPPEDEHSSRTAPTRFLPDGWPNPKAMDAWEYLSLLNDQQRDSIIWYLYRTAPTLLFTDKQIKYIAKGSHPISKEEIDERFGGKKWRLDVNRISNSGQQQLVYSRVKYENDELEPKLQPGERLAPAPSEENKGAAAAAQPAQTSNGSSDVAILDLLKTLIGDIRTERDRASRENQPFNMGEAVQKAIEMQGEGAKAAIEILKKQLGESKTDYSQFLPIITLLLERLLQPKSGLENVLIEKLFDRIATPHESKLETALMEKLLEKAFSTPPKDPLEQVERVINIASNLKGGGGGKSSVWDSLVENAGPLLTGAANLVGQIGNVIRLRPQPGAAPGAVPAAAAQVIPGTALQPGEMTADQLGRVPNPTPSGNGGVRQITEDEATEVVRIKLKMMIVRVLANNGTGEDAAAAAAMMDPLFAMQMSEAFKSDLALAKEGNLDKLGMRSDPIFSQIANNPQLLQRALPFTQEFVNYFTEEEEAAKPPVN